ncbi:MAG: helix-turn-helix transcriptional regulator [Opitutales bacterium]|nr:helix-turn-helix transcriptional regulator [Opitutales bacterium]
MNSAVIVERRSTDQAAVEDPAIDRLLRQLRLQPQAEYSMEEWSRLARLSERSLQRRFRLATGSTPQQYIKILRIDQARRLLAESSLPITQVAELAGFGDSKWFHRAFQAATGLSPRAYRQRILSQSPDNGS